MKKRVEIVLVIFFFSGMSGLAYESVWSHYVQLFLGHAAYAQTLVLIVFIGGLALGSWLCARVAERIRNPLRAYAAVEAAIGLLALVFHSVFIAATDWAYASLLPASCDQASTFCAAQWLLSAALLAPQSILLGMTFPLASSAVLRMSREYPGNDIAALYFLNSLGAVMGVLASAFVFIPRVGLPGTLMSAGMLNLLVAAVAYFVSKEQPAPLVVARTEIREPSVEEDRRLRRILLAIAMLTGLSSFLYEIAWVRMLSLVLGASTYAFELMLASFILGLALGGAWVKRRVDQVSDPVRLLAFVQLFMGLAAAATIPVYSGTFDFMAWLLSALSRTDGGFVFFSLSSTLIALLVMLPATFCAGMTLPLITFRMLSSTTGEKSLGLVYAANTLGGILGVALAVHLLLPVIGLRDTLLLGAAIDVALGAFLLVAWRPQGESRARIPWPAVAAGVTLIAMALAFDIDPRRSASGVFRSGNAVLAPSVSVAFHRDGKTATVDVLDTQGGLRAIATNGKSDAAIAMSLEAISSADETTMVMLALLPMGHNPQATRAAVIGFGSGMSTSVLLGSPTLQQVDTVEIEPAIVEGAMLFRPITEAAYVDPRSHIVIDDAKSYFARGHARYDIVVSEPSNPWVSGVASLFTAEFYARLSGYLNEGGVLAQWLHTYEIDAVTLASILRAVSATFPDYLIYTANDADIVLVARKGGAPGRFDDRVLEWPKLAPMLERLQMRNPEVVHRRLVGSAATLGPLFGTYRAALNSDYFPFVERRAGVTRFLRGRVNDMLLLQVSPVPMLEMLDGSGEPGKVGVPSRMIAAVDRSVAGAVKLNDLVMLDKQAVPVAMDGQAEVAAQLIHYWISDCRPGLEFEQMLPSLLTVSSLTIPFLERGVATRLWEHVANSRCLARARPEERAWLQLLVALARRDADAISAVAMPILTRGSGLRTDGVELAFLAEVTGLLCRGDSGRANALLDHAYAQWLRPDMRLTEYRYLRALATTPGWKVPLTGACAPGRSLSAGATDSPPPAARSTGK
jgi:spermidine synthase